MYLQGATAGQVGERFGLSEMTVLKRLREHGVEIRKAGQGLEGSPKRRLDAEQSQEVARLYRDERMSSAHLAARFECSKSAILAALRRAGVEPTRRRLVSDETLQELGRRYEAGESPDVLAGEVGYGRGGLMAAFTSMGVKMRQPGKVPMTADEPRAAKALALWDDGMGFKRAAHKAGIDEKTLRRILHETHRDPSARRSGPGHPLWKGGRYVTEGGYVRVWMAEDDPLAKMRSERGYVLEHRLVMARELGRALTRDESVHHKNGVRDDNRAANLELWTGQHGNGVRHGDTQAHCPTCTCFVNGG
jgi:transposase